MHNGLPVRYGKPTRRKSRFPIIMVIIIIILALVAGIYFVHGIFFDKDTEEVTETVNIQQPEPEKEIKIEKPQDNTPAETEEEIPPETEEESEEEQEETENTEIENTVEENINEEPEAITEDKANSSSQGEDITEVDYEMDN